MYNHYGKRFLDVTLSLLALIILSPVILLTALLVRLKLCPEACPEANDALPSEVRGKRGISSPILFRQQRPGMYGKPFILNKFRTMTDARDPDGNLLPPEERGIRAPNTFWAFPAQHQKW